MSKQSLESFGELCATLATEPSCVFGTHRIVQDALRLLALGKRAQRLAVRYCNGEGWSGHGRWDEHDDKRYDRAMERIKRDANGIAAHYQAEATVGGDPRGYVLKLQLVSKRSNSFGNDGYGVA